MTASYQPAVPLALTLFGSLEVRLEGQPRSLPRSRKAQWLLALLALQHGHHVERSWLAATLWPEAPESQALFYLRRTLTDLRHWLGSFAHTIAAPTARTLYLDLAGAAADVVAFDHAIARGDPQSLLQAVALYRGPLLSDCSEEWVLPERQAREQASLQALEKLAAEATAHGDHTGRPGSCDGR